MLRLFEELFLLALDDDKGVVIAFAGASLNYGLAGAVLAELALLKRVRVNEKRRLEVVDTTQVGDEILDQALQQLMASEHYKKIDFWVNSFAAQLKKIRARMGDRLVDSGVLTREDGHFLWVTPMPTNMQFNGTVKYAIKQRVRNIVLGCETSDLHDLGLLSLLQASKLTKLVFTRDERRTARRHIYQLVVREAMINPVAQTMEEIAEAVSTAAADANG